MNGTFHELEDPPVLDKKFRHDIDVVVDRIVVRGDIATRLADSFRDFLASPRMRPAAEFFLTDLYGERDFSARDRDVARILPLMARLLPDTLLVAATDAIELAVLSHAFDLRMAGALAARPRPGAPITVEDYAAAYRAAGCPRR